jgi:hypothetical protein
MNNIFFKKTIFYFVFYLNLNSIFTSCKFGDIKSISQCKVSAINYSLLKYNSFNQIEGAEISNMLSVKYEYDNAGNITRQNIYNNNILNSYISFTWDNTKNAIQISKFEKSQNTFQESQRDTFFLDNLKRVVKIKKSDSSCKRFEYQNDNVTRVYYYDGTQPEYLYIKYDAFDSGLNPYYNASMRMFMYDDTGNGFHFSKNNAVQCTYYNSNASINSISLLMHTYDNNGNPIKLESPTGQNWYFSYVCN